jgi:ubiquinone/menaquinone biosynthesis C-methylase UbiE
VRWSRRFHFYLPLVIATASVLNVGCGTGALLIAARDQRHTGHLTGLDPTADVPVVVNQAPMDASLLGMSFLRRMKSFDFRGNKLYLRWH